MHEQETWPPRISTAFGEIDTKVKLNTLCVPYEWEQRGTWTALTEENLPFILSICLKPPLKSDRTAGAVEAEICNKQAISKAWVERSLQFHG